MAKYVEFDFENKKPVYYEVNDFDINTIRALKSYKDSWICMKFVDGEKRMSTVHEGEILDIFPADTLKIVYWGKKISYEKVKRIVGNDLKYKDLLGRMNMACRNALFAQNIEFVDEADYSKRLDEYREDFDDNHYCLFRTPNNFISSIFDYPNAITIEEFDKSIKLDYDEYLDSIESNAMYGEEYIKGHEFLLKVFKNYFNMLCETLNSPDVYPNSDSVCEIVFSTCPFNFHNFEDLSTIEDINFFLDICDYTYNLSCDLFKKYRSFINEYYKQLEQGEEPKI